MSNLTVLTNKLAERFGMEAGNDLSNTLKATCFKSSTPVNDSQMQALLIVANQYGLNPFTKEIYAFPDKGGIVPVVGVDGWARIINEHPQNDGIVFEQTDTECTCKIYRKDRSQPTVITEYLSECKRDTQPWRSHPKRMLRHKALIQAARVAFGFTGIYEQDEAERIIESPAKHMGNVEIVEDPDYMAYKHKFGALLNDAASFGSDALKKAFAALDKCNHKAKLWTECSESLKAVAAQADEAKREKTIQTASKDTGNAEILDYLNKRQPEPAKAEEPAILDDDFVRDMGE